MRWCWALACCVAAWGCVGAQKTETIRPPQKQPETAAPPEPPPKTEPTATPPPQEGQRIYPLSELKSVPVSIGRHQFRAWVMDTDSKRMEGFMFVKASDFKPDQGMLFVFKEARQQGFWMQNVSFDLDIAYIGADRKIVSVHTMKAMDTNATPSKGPAMYALEVKAGTFKRLGIAAGMRVDFPTAVRAVE